MARTSLPSVLDAKQQLPGSSPARFVTDTQLLTCFLQDQDEQAFELLMRRHSPMVRGVCRRILRHTQDAEDAFQAAFLVLARRAATISKCESISGWLYMVAFRIALRAKARNRRRGQREKPLDDLPADIKSTDPADSSVWSELRNLLDAELSRIPEKYRTVFVLCQLEGKSCGEAAEHLGCPYGTVLSRLGRARQRLQERLALRGWLPALAHLPRPRRSTRMKKCGNPDGMDCLFTR